VQPKHSRVHLNSIPVRRVPQTRSLLCGIAGAVPHCAETADPTTTLHGATKRILAKLPSGEPQLLAELEAFVYQFVRSNFEPLSSGSVTVQQWSENTNMPRWRMDDIMAAYYKDYFAYKGELDRDVACLNKTGRASKRLRPIVRVGTFAKKEFYPVIKPSRNINARPNAYKAIVGPFYAAMEQLVYALPWFIKHVPVRQRAGYIMEHVVQDGAHHACSDYRSFECAFTRAVQKSCEFVLYEYMMQNQEPEYIEWMRVQYAETHIEGKGYWMTMDPCRMSGEMCTSLGNGFTNLMVMMFVAQQVGATGLKGVVEGDDGLFSYYGPVIDRTVFARLGFDIDIVPCVPNEASFCGNIFATDTGAVITDPYYTMATAGWSFSAVGQSWKTVALLTYAKGMSMMFGYPGCPILPQLGARMMRTALEAGQCSKQQMTDTVDKFMNNSRLVNSYELERYNLNKGDTSVIAVSHSTRVLFEKMYYISIPDQLRIESALSADNGWYDDATLMQLWLDDPIHSGWVDNWGRLQYVYDFGTGVKTPVHTSKRICLTATIDDLSPSNFDRAYAVDFSMCEGYLPTGDFPGAPVIVP
jgi:hypothetical protein